MSFSSAQGWAERRSSFADFIVGQEASTEGEITAPYGLAARDGKVYICDLGNHTVHVVDMARKAYAKLGGSKLLQNPVNITIAADGTKYVCDTGLRKVVVFDAEDRFLRFLGDPAKCTPSALAVYGGELYVADVGGAEVEVWAMDGKLKRVIARKGTGPADLHMPTNIAIGPGGRVFVSDTVASTINVYDTKGDYLGSVGAPGDSPGFFARPKGIAIDPAGRIYAADAQWEIVQLFAPDGQLLLFFGGGGPDPQGMGMPAGLAIDATSLPAFRSYVDKDFVPEYLLFVANQFGKHKIGVYAFGRSTKADYSKPLRPASRPTTLPTTQSATQPAAALIAVPRTPETPPATGPALVSPPRPAPIAPPAKPPIATRPAGS
jgi:sugar lactone lactonase YvrE